MEAKPLETTADQKIDIKVCGSCRGKHEGVAVVSFANKNAPWTHWYACPKTGDPVPTGLYIRNGVISELSGKVIDSLVAAEHAGTFLYFCFYPDHLDPTKLQLDRVGWNFSEKHYEHCIEQITKNLRQETHAPEPAKLKEVPPPVPAVQMFGKEE
jgi:hypothetical protein